MGIRILTNRDFILKKSIEYIEIDNNILYWKGEDELLDCGFSFPITLEFAEYIFNVCGRKLDKSKLPSTLIENPYEIWGG